MCAIVDPVDSIERIDGEIVTEVVVSIAPRVIALATAGSTFCCQTFT